MTLKNTLYTFLGLLSGIFILIYLDGTTLFLSALLLGVLIFKTTKIDLDKILGTWLALSVAPAFGVAPTELLQLTNGFLVQSILSSILFMAFYTYKPSIIGRVYKNSKANNIGILISAIIAGFAAGILSSLSWQSYLNFISF
jgi:phosphatidylglycerophosphatase A